ncbi:MAG: PKD domain-containing protein [Proteobacteria bacterium]|nr:PKD domain-containing protein [Pseudomonadota bacterium]MBU4353962.1 PKD domain-containing protein [Pseudomonadota bacterium]MBU4449337.1 PKD domain-containing protein [Pseudomonadota bacterium]MCG2771876.1 PKD domain-containing protein [Desulfobacterales bacterium]
MHKFRATYFGAFILGWLLAFGSHAAWGYYPPLQATGSYSSHEVSYTVYNPQKQQGYTAYHNYPDTITVVNLQQHNGVIAWVTQDGASYSVSCVTFDPALNTFQNAWWGPFTSVSQLQVKDGVVAFVAGMPPSGSDPAHPEFKYATYDPAKGAWQYGDYWVPSFYGLNLTTKDGVVLFRYVSPSSFPGVNFNGVAWDIYDPKLGKWWPDYVGGNSYNTTSPIELVYISNVTIYFSADTLDWVHGYNPSYDFPFSNPWNHSPTKPLAYFVAQPKLGGSPLWVWFTDMSIAGANWNWNFGDTSTSTSRSPYHTFTSPGNFQVTQWISGPSTYSQTIIVGYPSTLKGKSLPAMLHLLLLTN